MTHARHGDPDAVEPGVRVTDKRRIDPDTGAVRPGYERPTHAGQGGQTAAAGASDVAAAQAAGAAPGGAVPAGEAGAGSGEAADEVDVRVAELTSDLQRITAEYANYRKRVERDRVATREITIATVLAELLPVLDDIERAREHGELTDGFKAVGDAIQAVTAKFGLERFGEPGDPFDPTIHEALAHSEGEDLECPTCVEIYQPGYRLKDRVVRPARVIVKE